MHCFFWRLLVRPSPHDVQYNKSDGQFRIWLASYLAISLAVTHGIASANAEDRVLVVNHGV